MIYSEIQTALHRETENTSPHQTLSAGLDSPMQGVNELATSSVRAAVASTQMFIKEYFGTSPQANVNRSLVDQWCMSSVMPQGWSLPSEWDAFARDYQTRDGWIRLHTNAQHHRERAIAVLGGVTAPEEAQEAVAQWQSQALETAIVDAGGCAASLRTRSEWQSHPQGIAIAKAPIVDWQLAPHASPEWQLRSPQRPLQGLRVLDLTRVIAGPVATRFLASLGANVLRIDPPHWDEGGNSIDIGVGKNCAELNFHQPEDYAQLIALIQSAHVLVHGYRKDALPRLGLTTARLSELNPALISVSINAYGATGPWAHRRGFDSLVQRSSGLAVQHEGAITALPYQALDHATGYLAAATVMQALRIQHAGGGVATAHLSLARQAQLMLDAEVIEAHEMDKPSATSKDSYAATSIAEKTDWGPILRLPLPYQLEGVDVGWATPARKLRSSPPSW
ncbi:CoA transferase [Thaumasiovibrio subtropicus]|uniref:CoA transferase n=1 Tax=Thaumasiovibrio subtropicus TaxID=1891207 RepID=UPI000B360497|nr:CoA transferase [Thaumasiovibrio subtropicus]